MDQSTFNDLCRLLERIEPLKDQRRLKALVSLALLNHQVIDEVQWDGAPGVVISELLRACRDFDQPTEQGETPLCALLGALRDEGLTDGRVKADFDRLRERLGCSGPAVDWPHDPYPGMLALDHTQAPIFFGRTAETADLLARLQSPQGRRLLVVAGASGSGKVLPGPRRPLGHPQGPRPHPDRRFRGLGDCWRAPNSGPSWCATPRSSPTSWCAMTPRNCWT